MSSEKNAVPANVRPQKPEVTFQDIAAIWGSLDDVGDPFHGQGSRILHIRQETEKVQLSLFKYMHAFSSISRDKERPFMPKIQEVVGGRPDFFGYDTNALLQALRSQKDSLDKIANKNIYRVRCEIKGELERSMNDKYRIAVWRDILHGLTKWAVTMGSIVLAPDLRPTIRRVPHNLILGFFGGTFVVTTLSYSTYTDILIGLNQRVNELKGLYQQLYQLQDQANAFRSMISDLIIDTQWMKISESEGNKEEIDKLSTKIHRARAEAFDNEVLIKYRILLNNPSIVVREELSIHHK